MLDVDTGRDFNQLQPIRTNDDPLNVTIGNPNLKPQFINRFGLNFNDYKILTDRGIWIDVSYSFTENAISSNVLDTMGKRSSQSINVDGNHNYSGYLGYNFKWRKPGLSFYVFSNFNESGERHFANQAIEPDFDAVQVGWRASTIPMIQQIGFNVIDDWCL